MEHFSNINDLWATEPFKQVNSDVQSQVNALLGVQSNYFTAKIEVLLSERKRQFSSDLVRKDKTVYVVYRSMAPF
ncbi:General secretion pathway protein K [compost metagenome]